LLWPTTFLLLMTTTICSRLAFTQFDQLTGGGPVGATTTLVYYVYNTYSTLTGVASAAATILLVGVLAVVIVQFTASRLSERG